MKNLKSQSTAPTAIDERVAAFATARFGPAAAVQRLTGDASDRSYFRLRTPSLSSLILMVHAEPFELESLPWFVHGRFLQQIGAAVPQVVASYPAEGILVIQDLGDQMLQTHLPECDASRRRFLYLQAVQIIAFLQSDGTHALTPDLPAWSTALDRERLLFELRFFAEHYIRGLLRSPLSDAQTETLDAWFLKLAVEVSGYRRVLCHRDYHSRNLMLKGDRLFMVDFQDMRMGPFTYDLASLVRDAYVDPLPAGLVDELLDFFREASRAPEPSGVFRVAYARTCLQRNIKAIGTFASQAMLRNNQVYLPYIPRTIEHVKASLRLDATDEAAAVLELFSGPLDYR